MAGRPMPEVYFDRLEKDSEETGREIENMGSTD
jgi:hypothetical protein